MTDSRPGASPSSTHYFYTDSLAAAWMAKHFGMLFEPDDIPTVMDYDAFMEDFCDLAVDRYYIHPDSQHLLVPNPSTDLAHHGILGDSEGPNTIIQRNGKAFHWPEREPVTVSADAAPAA